MKILFLLALSLLSKCDTVCDEVTLLNELRQDIVDNGKLDCTRSARKPKGEVEETNDQRKNRLAAVWDSDCSFEAHYDWHSKLKTTYNMDTG
jgi:hypothetical protein